MTASYSGISFSGSAPHSSTINALPPTEATRVGEVLAALVPATGLTLDMGCGAGRIAVPAAQAGLQVIGLDRDPTLLGATQAMAREGMLPLSVLRGDVVRLPFEDDSFEAVLAINLLSLVPEWATVINEVVRVLRHGGVFIQGNDWLDPDSCAGRLQARLHEELEALAPGLKPAATVSPEEVTRMLAEHSGATEADMIAASWTTLVSPAELLDQMASRAHSETWMLDNDLLSRLLERLRSWAAETWPDLSLSEAVERRFVVNVTRGLRKW